MVDVLYLARVVTMSVAHPYSIVCLKVMVINVNLTKDRNCSASDVLTYISVKDYSFCGSAICPYAHTLVRSYEGPFPPQSGIFLYTNSKAFIP